MVNKTRVILTALFFIIFTPVLVFAGIIDLPVTGQTKCYEPNGAELSCAGTGQDGDIRAGVAWPDPRFTNVDGSTPINGDCVLDRLTGLMWPSNAYHGSMPWYQAMDYANNFTLCGYSDWFLPNINELESLLNVNEPNPAIWLNSQGFYNVQSYFYWSSTSYVNNYAWFVYMGGGNVYNYSKDNYYYVWPARSAHQSEPDPSYPANLWETGQKISYYTGDDGDSERGVTWPDPRFMDNEDATVTDNLTGLMWLKDANCMTKEYPSYNVHGDLTWEKALDFVKGINNGTYSNCGAGYYDWRLPNRKEIMSLVDRSQSYPALPAGFPFINVQPNWYWSSTISADFTKVAWDVRMWDGYLNVYGDYNRYVWPVRGGQVGAPVDYYCDKDNDGYLSPLMEGTCTGISCVPAGCLTTPGNDCNDDDYIVNPGKTEGFWGDATCTDGKDNNCNGFADADDPLCRSVAADLAVISITVPASSVTGSTINVYDKIKNNGPGSAPASTASYYWSDNSMLDAGDILLGSRSVPALSAGSAVTDIIPLTVPIGVESGTYYIIVKADASNAFSETNEDNNTGYRYLAIQSAVSDLVVSSIAIKPWFPLAGQDVTVTVKVKNQGTAGAGAFSVDIYKHRETAPYPGLGGDATCIIPALAAGSTATCVETVRYEAGGSYTIWAQADTKQEQNETNEDNNTGYRYLAIQSAVSDLVVSSIAIKPWFPLAGQDVTATVKVKNWGTAGAGAFSVDIYKHRDTAPYPGLGGDATCIIPALATGSTATCVQTVRYEAGGSYTMWAQADTKQEQNEANEGNNTGYRYLAIQSAVSDLVVSSIAIKPWSPSSGQDVTVTVKVKNQGTAGAGAFSVDIYKHRETAPYPGLGGDATCIIPALATGSTATCVETVRYEAGGFYKMWTQVDTNQQQNEANEGNNTGYRYLTIQAVSGAGN